ncbi:MAG: hypothetical protein Q9173_003626 [Seirophora scorigena]
MEHDLASDYGSDFSPEEDIILSHLLHQQAPSPPPQDPGLILRHVEDDESPRGARIPRTYNWRQHVRGNRRLSSKRQTPCFGVEVADDDGNPPTNVESPESREGRSRQERSVSIEAPPLDLPPGPVQPEEPDLRSPLERFRTKPKKALSVTDLISPSWCELQYWFTLTKHGRKRRTPAMKQGSAVHRTLEDEVHHTVAVSITTKEDAWGLRIWNAIQGLRTLRETGMTRELEVWGILDGLVVNGVIDELSYTCPDPELEATEERDPTDAPPPTLSADQKSITDFLSPNNSQTLNQANCGASAPPPSASPAPSVYITDVKTRTARSVPKAASFRPTLMQLMLYHRLLSSMVAGETDTGILFPRYDLRPNEPFTDAFIAQISGMFSDTDTDPPPSTTSTSSSPSAPANADADTLSLLLAHNSLASLWRLLTLELRRTFPLGATSVGRVLKAEYRRPSDGQVTGSKTVRMDDALLDAYTAEGMRWWRGERQAVGVCLEEAYKCGSCEFAEECGWRRGKLEEATEKARLARKSRGRSEV